MKKVMSVAALVLFGISLNVSAGDYFPERDRNPPKPAKTSKKPKPSPFQVVPIAVFQDGQFVIVDYVIHTYYDANHAQCAVGGKVVRGWIDLNSNSVVDGEETLSYNQVTCAAPYRHEREFH